MAVPTTFTEWLNIKIVYNAKYCNESERPQNYWVSDDQYLATLINIQQRGIDSTFGDWLERQADESHAEWMNMECCDRKWHESAARQTVFSGVLKVWNTFQRMEKNCER